MGRIAPLAMAALAGLAACAAPETNDSQGVRLAAEFDRSSAALRAAGAGMEPWNAPVAGTAAPTRTSTQDGVGPEPRPPVAVAAFSNTLTPDARGLVGASAPTVLRVLGAPDLRRRDGDADVWLYHGRTCALDVVFYPDTAGRDGRVAFAAARAIGIERVAEHACLQEIQRASQLVATARR